MEDKHIFVCFCLLTKYTPKNTGNIYAWLRSVSEKFTLVNELYFTLCELMIFFGTSHKEVIARGGCSGFRARKMPVKISCRIKQAIQKYGLHHIKPQSGLKLWAGQKASLHYLSSLLQYGLKADFPRCDALLAYGLLSFAVWPNGPPMAL